MKQLNEKELRMYAQQRPMDEIDAPNIQDILNKGIPGAVERDAAYMQAILGHEEAQEQEKAIAPQKDVSQKKEEEQNKQERKEEKKKESPDEKKNTDWETQARRVEKNYKETRKWAEDVNKKISSYKRSVLKLAEEGDISDEQAEILLSHTQHQELDEKDDFSSNESSKTAKIWNQEIEYIRRYGNYDDLDDHIAALQHLVSISSKEEIEELFDEAKSYIDEDPVKYVKKILEVGKDYYDDVYKEFHQAGNLKNFKSFYEDEIKKHKKTIDKLEKEVVKLRQRYEDYDKSFNYDIPQGSAHGGSKDQSLLNSPGNFIDTFNQGKYRNR